MQPRDLVRAARRPDPQPPPFPVLIYRGVDAAAGAVAARALFAAHGWGGSWVDGVFDFHHFHSTSHEALAVVAGRATLELGGPQGEAFDVAAGDVLVLPPAPATGARAPRRVHRRRRVPRRAGGLRPAPRRVRPRSRPRASGSPRSAPRRETRSAATASRGGRRTPTDEPARMRQSHLI